MDHGMEAWVGSGILYSEPMPFSKKENVILIFIRIRIHIAGTHHISLISLIPTLLLVAISGNSGIHQVMG